MEIKKLDRPIESYIQEIEKVIGNEGRIYLDEIYADKLRRILKEIVNKFGDKKSAEKDVLSEPQAAISRDHYCILCGEYIAKEHLQVCDKCASEYKF